MVKRNISLYERKKEIITKTWIFHERKSSYYEKVLVLNFSEMWNTVFFWFTKLMYEDLQHGIPCFLNMEKFLFWTFQRWEIRSSFDSKSWCKMIFSSSWNTIFFEYGKVLGLNFSEIGNMVFFYLKSWWKVDIFLVFLNFSWYSRTWKIWFFVQWMLPFLKNVKKFC